MDRLDRNNKTSVESLGRFEYDTKERLGFGAFAIVFKGWLKEVRLFVVKSVTYVN